MKTRNRLLCLILVLTMLLSVMPMAGADEVTSTTDSGSTPMYYKVFDIMNQTLLTDVSSFFSVGGKGRNLICQFYTDANCTTIIPTDSIKSKDESVATVTTDPVSGYTAVNFVGYGNTTLTATVDDETYSIPVAVNLPDIHFSTSAAASVESLIEGTYNYTSGKTFYLIVGGPCEVVGTTATSSSEFVTCAVTNSNLITCTVSDNATGVINLTITYTQTDPMNEAGSEVTQSITLTDGTLPLYIVPYAGIAGSPFSSVSLPLSNSMTYFFSNGDTVPVEVTSVTSNNSDIISVTSTTVNDVACWQLKANTLGSTALTVVSNGVSYSIPVNVVPPDIHFSTSATGGSANMIQGNYDYSVTKTFYLIVGNPCTITTTNGVKSDSAYVSCEITNEHLITCTVLDGATGVINLTITYTQTEPMNEAGGEVSQSITLTDGSYNELLYYKETVGPGAENATVKSLNNCLMQVGSNIWFAPYSSDENALTGGTFESSDTGVVTVEYDGTECILTAVGVGTATVTYTVGTTVYSAYITVNLPDIYFSTSSDGGSMISGTYNYGGDNSKTFYLIVGNPCTITTTNDVTSNSDYVSCTITDEHLITCTVSDGATGIINLTITYTQTEPMNEAGGEVTQSITLTDGDDSSGEGTLPDAPLPDGPPGSLGGSKTDSVTIDGTEYVAGFVQFDGGLKFTTGGGGLVGVLDPQYTYAPGYTKGSTLKIALAKVTGTDNEGNTTYEVITAGTPEAGKVTYQLKKLHVEMVEDGTGTIQDISLGEPDYTVNDGSINLTSYYGSVTSFDDPIDNIYSFDDVYLHNGTEFDSFVYATVEVYNGTTLWYTLTPRIYIAQEYSTTWYEIRPDDDTVDALNAWLLDISDPDSDNYLLEDYENIRLTLGKSYEGTINIPKKIESKDKIRSGIRGHASGTTITGSINLGYVEAGDTTEYISSGGTGMLEDITFIAPETTETTVGLYNGHVTDMKNCTFYNYDIAVDASAGNITVEENNTFINNGIAVRIDTGNTIGSGNSMAWKNNAFINNETAIQVKSLSSIMSSFQFRIVDSNFINNGKDFDVSHGGTIYMYRNHFGQYVEVGGKRPSPGKYHADKCNSPEELRLDEMQAATTKSKYEAILEYRSVQATVNSDNGSRVIANPRWLYPVIGSWNFGNILVSNSTETEANYVNALVADWENETEIVNSGASELVIDDSAFTDTSTEKTIDVVDDSGNQIATWTFPKVEAEDAIILSNSDTTGFNAGLTIDTSVSGQISVIVEESSVIEIYKPTLTIPTSYSSAAVTLGDSDVTSSIDADGNVSFTVAEAGEYEITNTEPASLWFTNGPGEPRAFSGSLTEPQGANWTMYLYYGTYSDVWNGSSVEPNTKKSGTLTSGDSKIISVSGGDNSGWQLSMLSQGTTTLTYETDTNGDNVNETFELTVTVGPPMSEGGDSVPSGELRYRTLSVSGGTVTEDDTSELQDYRGLASGTPVGSDVFVKFYFVVDGTATVAENCTLTSSDTTVASVTAIANIPGGFQISVLKEGTTNFLCEYGDISSETGMTFSSSGGSGEPEVVEGSCATIGDYIVGFIWNVDGGLTGSVQVVNPGEWGIGNQTPYTGQEGYSEYASIPGIGVGKKENDDSDYYLLQTDSSMTVTVKKVWIALSNGNDGDVSFSNTEPKTTVEGESLDVTQLQIYAKNVNFGGLVWAEFDVTEDGTTTTHTASFSMGQILTYSADCSNITDANAINTVLQNLAAAQSTQPYNIQLGKYVIGDIKLPDLGIFNFNGATNGTVLYGSMDLNGKPSDINNIFFVAPKTATGETRGLYNGICQKMTNCFFYNYDIAVDGSNGFPTVTSGNVFVNNGIAVKVDAEAILTYNQEAWKYNVFINNGTAVQILSIPMSSFYFRVTRNIFFNNGIDFDAQHGGTLYMYHNYYGRYLVESDAHRPQPGKYADGKYNGKEHLKLDDLRISYTQSRYNTHFEYRGASISESNGSKVITNTRGNLPVKHWWNHLIDIKNVFEDGGSKRPDQMALAGYTADTNAEAEYTIMSTSDWESETEIINADADDLTIDSSAFATETDSDKIVTVVDNNESLLGTWTFGTIEENAISVVSNDTESDSFNAKLTIDTSVSGQISVTVEHSDVLRTYQPTLTVPCAYSGAYVTCDGEEVAPTVDTENGTISFTVAKGGEYTIVKKFDIDGATMTLGNSLAINFFIEPDDLVEGEGYYAVITKKYADGRADVTETINQVDWSYHNDYKEHYVTFNGVAAKEMTDELTVTVYNGAGIAVSNVWVDSVRGYAMRMLNNEETDAKKLPLYVDMLNYGAAAQTYFKYHVDDLANSQLTDAQKKYATEKVEMTDYRDKGTGYSGSNLTLESDITLNVFFEQGSIDQGKYAVASFTDHYGKEKSVRVERSDFQQLENDTDWYVPVKGLVVADVRQLVTVKVYNSDEDVIASCIDSIESYVARMSSENALYEAIMKFGVSAYNYFHLI